jgi:phosphate transport system permease protein
VAADLRRRRNVGRIIGERLIQIVLLLAATVSVLTTVGIITSLITETIAFFQQVSFIEYFTETQWTPLFSIKKYGILTLVSATLLTSMIALAVAIPLGVAAAIYLSEFASPKVRGSVKSVLEILAGIPTVVYGFFALTVVTPFLKTINPDISIFNSLSAGLVMGVMIIPLVTSLSEDALSSVPSSLREAAYGLGSTKFEVATKVVVPAAISGIVASFILAMSRVVGETMIVAIAAGQTPTFTFDPTVPVMTMTSYIVQVSLGDVPYGSLSYYTLFAVGMTLFVFTFFLNIFSYWVVRKFREVYD